MSGTPMVHRAPVDNAGRLYDLGLTVEELRECVDWGAGYRANCTLNHPPAAPAFFMWAEIVRALRERLIPQGWARNDARNYSTVVDPASTFAIAVASGDAFTGIEDKTPSTRREKGPATQAAVEQNQLTFEDIDPSFPRVLRVPTATTTPSGMRTWLLLHYVDARAEEVRSELSLPDFISAEGFVTSWRERIMLPPTPFTSPVIADAPADGPTTPIEVPVERRA